MKNEKKKLRFTAIDLFILILLAVVAVAFFGKNYFVSLMQNEKDSVAVVYTLAVDDGTSLEGMTAGSELQLSTGEKLGSVTNLRSEMKDNATLWYCEGEGRAVLRDGGFLFGSDLRLTVGQSYRFQCGDWVFVATVLEMKAK